MSTSIDTACAPQQLEELEKLPGHVVILTGFIPAHRLPVYVEVERRIAKLSVLLSTPMEPNRNWQPDWATLDVHVQQTLTVKRPRRHTLGFKDWTYVHVPYDTLRRLRMLRPDVIVSAELGFRSLFSALYRSVARRVCLVLWVGLSEHTELGKGWMRHVLRRWLLRRADGVIVNGESGRRYLERMGVAPERIFRIDYSCLPGQFDRHPTERGPEASGRLLFVGRFIELKGLLPFLHALRRWGLANPDRNVEFSLAGYGPLEEEIASFPVPPNVAVRMLGACDYRRLAEVYREAGIFVFPSLADDWGISVNEAMTAGLPVLGSVYSQAVAEMCADGTTGWTFRTDHQEELDRAIEAALSTPLDALNRMRRAARRRVQDRTPERGAGQLVEAIRRTLARKRTQVSSRAVQHTPDQLDGAQVPVHTPAMTVGMNGPQPRVSVGLPVYNGEKYVGEALQSLLGQTFEDFEVIVSDNASTDATEEICRHFAAVDRRVRYYRQPANRGPTWNFNHVFERARGEYFRWAAHDDVCAPTCLARCVEVLDANRAAILCCPRTAVIDEHGELIGEEGFPRWPEMERPQAPYLHDYGHPRRLDSDRPSTRYRGVLLLSTRCYEVFGLVRSDALGKTGLHGTYCGAEKVLLAELSLLGKFMEVPEVLFFNRWHSQRFSADPSAAGQHSNYHPASTRSPILPRQVRCSWGYYRVIGKAGLTWAETARCHVAFARYLLQFRKWGRVVANAIRRVDTSAEIPPGAKRLGRPAWITQTQNLSE